ncbi:hypothetical protein DW944_01590 [Eubacterium ventriosum]|mgnify:FL=1|uniref:Co-chaperone DjlA N-terminal domain-containing protein n=1 Tax=Eubacterium ventriosum TaxID=39496 RepID=A0A413RDN5_9FIRM|nr:TerB family tellurite resistance protein [Eubacterium ventriosum]MBS5371419.1 TerB family tellurite resistance protein [Coprobacillus cateniformis]RHA20890.1 hypothetical protein DW944_01590 [Eubacterium ventriosum]
MFLNYLKDESKENFLKLSMAAANANRIIEEEEKQMVLAYCKELGVKEIIPSEKIDIDKVLSELKEKTNKEEKKVIVFEILGLMYSDGEYDEVERNFIDNLINEFEITNEELNRIEELLNQYSELYKKIVLEIFNK